MALNADFSARVVIDTRAAPWTASPQPGEDRKLLDRVGDEVARSTSIGAVRTRFGVRVPRTYSRRGVSGARGGVRRRKRGVSDGAPTFGTRRVPGIGRPRHQAANSS